MAAPRHPLTSTEVAALTRLTIAYCLGRGSLCTVTRSVSLQLYHPRRYESYIHYQWRRICQFLPDCQPPRLHEHASGKRIDTQAPEDTAGQWRLRVSSRHFEIAQRLLYPNGTSAGILLMPETLSLAGSEAMASLWADRGVIRTRRGQYRGQPIIEGWLPLHRHAWNSAVAISHWIGSITGAQAQVMSQPRNSRASGLLFNQDNLARLLALLSDTWMAQAPCLRQKFFLPAASALAEELDQQRMAPYMVPALSLEAMAEDADAPSLPVRQRRSSHRAPGPIESGPIEFSRGFPPGEFNGNPSPTLEAEVAQAP